MKAMGVALLLAGAAGLAGVTNGAPGAEGSPPPAGPASPAPKRLMVKTASGEVIGPLVDTEDGGQLTVRYTVYVEALRRLIRSLDPASGRSAVLDVQYSTWDCTSAPWSERDRGGVLIAAGSRLFVNSGAAMGRLEKRAYLDAQGACRRYPSPVSALPAFSLQEVVDARYPYAAPLQVVYE